MGLFSRASKPPRQQVVDITRMRALFAENFGSPPPGIANQVFQVASEAGVRVEDLDHIAAITALYSGFNNLLTHFSQTVGVPGLPEAVSDRFDAHDFTEEGVWDAILGFGPKGVAIASFLAEQCTDGTLARAAAASLKQNGLLESQPFAQLPNPRLHDSDPRQKTFKLMDEMGFYVVVSGEGSPNELMRSVVTSAPVLARSDPTGEFGLIETWGLWSLWTTNHYSALAIFMAWDEDPSARDKAFEITKALESIGGGWTVANGRIGAWIPEAAVPTFGEGQLVPPRALDVFDRNGTREDRERLRSAVESAGFEPIGGLLYKGTFLGNEERTQLLWIAFEDELTLLSPIAEGIGDELPPQLQGQHFGRYTVAAVNPYAVIQLSLPYTVSENELREESVAITRYADLWEESLTPGRDDL